jgi:phosphoglycerate kinase
VAFAKELASLGDIYVNDALVPHRAHASTTIIAQFFQQQNVLIVVNKEIESLNKVLKTVKTSNCCFGWLRFRLKLRLLRIF